MVVDIWINVFTMFNWTEGIKSICAKGHITDIQNIKPRLACLYEH